MHETHIDQLRTIPLIADEEKRVAFRTELTQLLNRYGIDNACHVPDYLLACYLDSHLITVRNLVQVRDRLHPSTRTTPQEFTVRCDNCDGAGFIPPLTAVDAPTLQRWLDQSRQRCHLDQHPNGVAPVLGRNVTDYGARPFVDNKSEYLDDAVRYDTGGTRYRPFSSDDIYDQGLREIIREKGGDPCSQ